MALPEVPREFETFFESTRIWLFGKRFNSLTYNREGMEGEFSAYEVPNQGDLPMPPKRIERTLRRRSREGAEQFFARIYSFSYEAHYYRLPRPLLFLVNDAGRPVGGGKPGTDDLLAASENVVWQEALNGPGAENRPSFAQARRRLEAMRDRFSTTLTGVEGRDWDFSNDIYVWGVDRKDLTVCLDVEIGNYQEILLDSMITSDRRDEDRATRSRGDLIGRGAGSFRGDMIGPHQNK